MGRNARSQGRGCVELFNYPSSRDDDTFVGEPITLAECHDARKSTPLGK